MKRVTEEVLAQAALLELHFTLWRGAGHALEAQGARLGPVPHPGCPCPAPCSLRHCAGSLASAVSLIRASQPLQRGVGAPGLGWPLINSWSPCLQNLSSPRETQKQATGARGAADNKSPGSRRPLRCWASSLCTWNLPPAFPEPAPPRLLSSTKPALTPPAPHPPPAPMAHSTEFIPPFITLSGNC